MRAFSLFFIPTFLFILLSVLPEGKAQDVTPLQVLTPQPAGQSLLARLYREEAPKVVYVTGVNVDPDAKSPDEFFNLSNDSKEEHTVGTGFILHESGYVVTNTHTVNRTLVPEVEFINGHRRKARIAAIIPEEDLALLQFEPEEPISAVQVESNPSLYVGDSIVTIACPHALKFTMSYGIICAMDRTSRVTDVQGLTLEGLLQTNATVNPGSSGGPWFNLFGKVVGMTVSRREGSEGIAFGISLETILYRFPQLLHRAATQKWEIPFTLTGSRSPLRHRTRMMNLDPKFALQWNLKEGDCVQRINGEETLSAVDFYQKLLSLQTGETVTLSVSSPEDENATREITFTLSPRAARNTEAVVSSRLHMKVRPLTQEEREKFNLRVQNGVMITEIEPKHFQHLKYAPVPGDVLARVNHERIESPEHLTEILENTHSKMAFDLVFLRLEPTEQKTLFTRIDINQWNGK